MAGVERVVRHALLSYIDPDGVQRMAVRGDTVRLSGDELKRAERFEAVVAAEADLAEELEEIRAAEAAADAAMRGVTIEGPASSPAGAQGDDEDEDDLAVVVTSDGVEHVGVLPASAAVPPAPDEGEDGEEDLEGPTAPPKTAVKELWVDYRFAQQDGRLSKEQLVELDKKVLQDDEFIAALQPASAS